MQHKDSQVNTFKCITFLQVSTAMHSSLFLKREAYIKCYYNFMAETPHWMCAVLIFNVMKPERHHQWRNRYKCSKSIV